MRSLLLLSLVAAPLAAQTSAPAVPAAPVSIPPAEQQIAAAVLALPAEMRDGATVMGYKEAGKLVVLREGKNGMHCLALYVMRPDFHVACYHKSLEPFMARGRSLRAEGVKGEQVDSARFKEIKSGKLKMPKQGSLYTLTTKKENYDAATNKVSSAGLLTVLYIPGATMESLGITSQPRAEGPWIMFPGTPKAHVMMSGKM
jgi:hypothetical protein